MKPSMSLGAWGIFLFLVWCASVGSSVAADPPGVKSVRATLGDTMAEPAWDRRLTVTVGPANADIIGTSEKTIQAAIEYVTRFGGGTVKLLPGTYRLRNAVYLQSKVHLLGSGTQTVLIKEPSTTTTLAQDSDWFDQEITLADAQGFAKEVSGPQGERGH